MVESRYIVKRKRKKVAAIVSAIATGAITTFVIIAFLGRRVGSFTIKMNSNEVKLSLSQTKSFEEETTYLMVDELPSFDINEYINFVDDEKFDNEETTYEDGLDKDPRTGEANALYYFKYTFYVKNVGTIPANYTMTLNITDNIKPSNVAYGYDDILRVKFYDNEAESLDHDFEVYAKRIRNGENKYTDSTGEPIYSELVWGEEGSSTFAGYCTNFENDSTVFTSFRENFVPGESRRMTMLMWLDGNDTQANGDAPRDGSIRLGLNINATEYIAK